MQYDTVGNPIIFHDQCAFCRLDTGGQHELWCPCRQSSQIKTVEEILKEIRERSHLHLGQAWQKLADM